MCVTDSNMIDSGINYDDYGLDDVIIFKDGRQAVVVDATKLSEVGHSCDGCIFSREGDCRHRKCMPFNREDGESVIFREVMPWESGWVTVSER